MSFRDPRRTARAGGGRPGGSDHTALKIGRASSEPPAGSSSRREVTLRPSRGEGARTPRRSSTVGIRVPACTVLVEPLAVVREDDEDRALGEAGGLEPADQSLELAVDVADLAVVVGDERFALVPQPASLREMREWPTVRVEEQVGVGGRGSVRSVDLKGVQEQEERPISVPLHPLAAPPKRLCRLSRRQEGSHAAPALVLVVHVEAESEAAMMGEGPVLGEGGGLEARRSQNGGEGQEGHLRRSRPLDSVDQRGQRREHGHVRGFGRRRLRDDVLEDRPLRGEVPVEER
jgi:hypothetical protein